MSKDVVFDYSDAGDQGVYEIIPDGTIAKVKFTITEGNYNDPSKGWNGGLATQGKSGSVYLNTKNTIVAGEHKNKIVFNLIGLHSPKGPTYKAMGESYIKAVIDSSLCLEPHDHSPETKEKRKATWMDLTEMVHLVEICTKHDQNGNLKNEIKKVITPNDIRYHEHMGDKSSIEVEFNDSIPF